MADLVIVGMIFLFLGVDGAANFIEKLKRRNKPKVDKPVK